MLGNRGSRIASFIISFMPTSRWHGLKRWLLRSLGGIEIGEGTTIFSGARFNGRYIRIGSHCHIGEGCHIVALGPDAWITIGDNCSFGPEVFMTTGGHDPSKGNDHTRNGIQGPIVIGNSVGLSVRAMVMCGVEIGDNCTISPGVCVSKNVKPYTLVGHALYRNLSLKRD